MIFNKVLLGTSIFFCVTSFVCAQNKNASVIFGAAATQIHGDGMAGYNKLGWEFGISVQSPIEERLYFQPEILFFQKGSQNGADTRFVIKYSLNYLELPMLLGYEVNDNIQIQGGLSFGYLLSGKVSSGISSGDLTESLRKIDSSVMIGGSYRFLANTSIKIRYSVSVIPISRTGNLVNDTASFLLIFHL